MTDPRQQLPDEASDLQRDGAVSASTWLRAFRDECFPELPDGAIRPAPGTHWKPVSLDGTVFALFMPDGTATFRATDRYLREHGQPLPDPTPEITVGCIASTRGESLVQVDAIANGRVIATNRDGVSQAVAWRVGELTYVAASWAEVPE